MGKEGGSKILNILWTFLVKVTYRSTRAISYYYRLIPFYYCRVKQHAEETWQVGMLYYLPSGGIFKHQAPKLQLLITPFPAWYKHHRRVGEREPEITSTIGKERESREKSRVILPNDGTNGFRSNCDFHCLRRRQSYNFYEQIIHSSRAS